MNLNTLQKSKLYFFAKYINAKKDKVLTKAIKYHPVEELIVTSVIYSDYYRRSLLFEKKLQLIALKMP